MVIFDSSHEVISEKYPGLKDSGFKYKYCFEEQLLIILGFQKEINKTILAPYLDFHVISDHNTISYII
jgi:hypothetical protein